MKGFLDLPYRLPFARHYKEFDRGFYVDFPAQLKQMGRWFQEHGCRKTLDIGAMTGGCIEYISRLGIRMDGVQFSTDLKRLAEVQLRQAGITSTLYVSPVHDPVRLPSGLRYDGIVTLGWLNLPFSHRRLHRMLARIRRLLVPGGVFMFDFFDFKKVIIDPPVALRLDDRIVHVAHTERLGSVLRRYHLWISKGVDLRAEFSDLVDRRPETVRSLLTEVGLKVIQAEFLNLNYPRHFWLVRKP
ncbi:MAG TPA: class I SAM-dependent methyltransferase [Planctomycetota bacterium]|nr:class I SAM-dependent methyltransferase [Planctomycetota bacterium]